MFRVVPEARVGVPCEHDLMPSVRSGRSGWIAPCAAWVLSAALLAVALLFDRRLAHIGRSDLRTFAPETWVLVAGMVSALVVGALLTVRRPEHPVGWLFLGLGLSMAVAGPIDGYATYGALARPGSLPGAAGAAHLGDVTFVPWLVLIAVILHLTPTGHPLTRAWGRLMWITVVAGTLAVLTGVLGERALDPPFEGVGNPWAIHALAGVFGFVGFLATFVVGIGLIGAERVDGGALPASTGSGTRPAAVDVPGGRALAALCPRSIPLGVDGSPRSVAGGDGRVRRRRARRGGAGDRTIPSL